MNSDDLDDSIHSIKSKDDFVEFLGNLIKNYENHPDDWDNKDIRWYLEGMYGFAMSIDGYYQNWNINESSDKMNWRIAADILAAGRVYE